MQQRSGASPPQLCRRTGDQQGPWGQSKTPNPPAPRGQPAPALNQAGRVVGSGPWGLASALDHSLVPATPGHLGSGPSAYVSTSAPATPHPQTRGSRPLTGLGWGTDGALGLFAVGLRLLTTMLRAGMPVALTWAGATCRHPRKHLPTAHLSNHHQGTLKKQGLLQALKYTVSLC